MNLEMTESEQLVQLWMEKIVQVQSGLLTASAAAKQMNMSRKTYYQKERRALSGMRAGLLQKDSGRPRNPFDEEKEKLKTEMHELREEVTRLHQVQRVREVMDDDSEKKR